MHEYIMVFESTIKVGTSLASCVIVLLVMSLLALKYANFFSKDIKGQIKFAAAILLLILGMTFYGAYIRCQENIATKNAVESKKFYICKGKIENFHAMPKWGHDREYFDVNGTHFEILYTGDYPNSKTLFYTLTKHRNGPIQRNGQKVKIHYITIDGQNKIIKLWVYGDAKSK